MHGQYELRYGLIQHRQDILIRINIENQKGLIL